MGRHSKLTHVRERQMLAAVFLAVFLTVWPWPPTEE